jgi:hypothetical protein
VPIAVAAGLGALKEVTDAIAVVLAHTGEDYLNTILDIAANVVGASVVSGWHFARHPRAESGAAGPTIGDSGGGTQNELSRAH